MTWFRGHDLARLGLMSRHHFEVATWEAAREVATWKNGIAT